MYWALKQQQQDEEAPPKEVQQEEGRIIYKKYRINKGQKQMILQCLDQLNKLANDK